MRVIIAGSRTIRDVNVVMEAIDRSCLDFDEVISGGAPSGPDRSALMKPWACPVRIMRADWTKWGKSAGYRRNVEMSQRADALIALWDGRSSGTEHMIRIMQTAGKLVQVTRVSPCASRLEQSRNGRPRRFITLSPEQVEYAYEKLAERDAACAARGIPNALVQNNQPMVVRVTGVAGEIAFAELCRRYGSTFDPTTHVRSWHSGLDRTLDSPYKGNVVDVKSAVLGKRKLMMSKNETDGRVKTLPPGAWVAFMRGDWTDATRPIFELVGFMLASELMVEERVVIYHSPVWEADEDELIYDIDPNFGAEEWEAQQTMMRIWFGEAA